MKKVFLSILIIAVTLLFSLPVFAELEFSGSVETIIGVQHMDQSTQNFLNEQLKLNLFMPTYGHSSATANLIINHNSLTKKVDLNFTKLYLSGHFTHFSFKIGRQPLGWNFGSLVNPLEYNLKSVNFYDLNSEEGSVDAAVCNYYAGTLSNLSAVVSVLDEEHLKWAVRGRTNVSGFDLIFNYIQEDQDSRRIGFAFKGDLFLEVYGGATYKFDKDFKDGKLAYTVGLDYSFDNGNDQKIILQAEYLKDQTKLIQPAIYDDELLLMNCVYPVDEFSTINLGYVRNLHDKSNVFLGKYSLQLDDGLDLSLNVAVFKGEDGDQYAPGTFGVIPNNVITLGFKYSY